jgi:hypothetical protein
MGGAAKTPSEPRREGDSAAVDEVLGDVAGARPGHPFEPSGIVYDRMSDGVRLGWSEASGLQAIIAAFPRNVFAYEGRPAPVVSKLLWLLNGNEEMPLLPNYKDIVELIRKGSTIEAQEKILELREAAMQLQEENLALRQENKALFRLT